MRKKESWMIVGARVIALGKVATIVSMQENAINGEDYVYYIRCKIVGETNAEYNYHPSDVEPQLLMV